MELRMHPYFDIAVMTGRKFFKLHVYITNDLSFPRRWFIVCV